MKNDDSDENDEVDNKVMNNDNEQQMMINSY